MEGSMKRRILVTGSEGYLMSRLIDRLIADESVEKVIGLDIRDLSAERGEKYIYHNASVTSRTALKGVIDIAKPDTVVHGAWVFNPNHDDALHRAVDIDGTRNLLDAAATSKTVTHIVYTGSTTAYAGIPENADPIDPSVVRLLKEEEWGEHAEKRKNAPFPYSRDKAIVDELFAQFDATHPVMDTFWMRGSIVLGPNTKNFLNSILESRVTLGLAMFAVKGYDPHFQFCGEEDMENILYRATMERWKGVANVAGEGTIAWSALIKKFGKWQITLPESFLRWLVGVLWKLHILEFPPSMLDHIMHPWLGDITKLKQVYGYTPAVSTIDAIDQMISKINRKSDPLSPASSE
jgi:UDP-glucose 4-epimerase